MRQFAGNGDNWTAGAIYLWGACLQQGNDPKKGFARTWAFQTAFVEAGIASAWLGAIDTILESTWVVSSASGLTTHSPSISSDGRVTTVWLKSGNASGAVYSATNHIKTAAGREGERSLRVTIVDR